MTGVRITVSSAELDELLGQIARVGSDPARVLRPIGRALIRNTQDRARRGVTPSGDEFEPHNALYWASKRNATALRESGRLMKSLSSQVSGAQLRVGTNTKYAAVHQFGATIKAKNAPFLVFKLGNRWVKTKEVEIPARPFLGISAEDLRDIRETIEGHIRRVTGR